jgi:hypothetical protein
MNDHRVRLVGICDASSPFFTAPVLFTRYSQALTYVGRERNLLSFVLVKPEPNAPVAELAKRITDAKGLAAMSGEQFGWATITYVIPEHRYSSEFRNDRADRAHCGHCRRSGHAYPRSASSLASADDDRLRVTRPYSDLLVDGQCSGSKLGTMDAGLCRNRFAHCLAISLQPCELSGLAGFVATPAESDTRMHGRDCSASCCRRCDREPVFAPGE